MALWSLHRRMVGYGTAGCAMLVDDEIVVFFVLLHVAQVVPFQAKMTDMANSTDMSYNSRGFGSET